MAKADNDLEIQRLRKRNMELELELAALKKHISDQDESIRRFAERDRDILATIDGSFNLIRRVILHR